MSLTVKQKANKLRREAEVLRLEEHAATLARKAQAATDPSKRAMLTADAMEAAADARSARKRLTRRRPEPKGLMAKARASLPAELRRLL